MMDQCSSPFGPWFYYNEEEQGMAGSHELRQFLLHTTMELDATVSNAHEEISRKEKELVHMKEILLMTIKERDEAQSKCQELLIEKASLQQLLHRHLQQQQQQQQQHLHKAASFSRIPTTNVEEKYSKALVLENSTNTPSFSFSSSDTEESSIMSEPPISHRSPQPQTPLPAALLPPQITATLVAKRPLPEKGKLLQAVKEAGPLLQTLLLAGPLPQWQHPPPQLDSIEIPPVTIQSPLPAATTSPGTVHQDSVFSVSGGGGGGCLMNGNNKRRCLENSSNNFDGCSVSSPASSSKYQRVV